MPGAQGVQIEDVDLPDASEDIGEGGGRISVDDEASPVNGYSIEVPENALSTTTEFDIWADATPPAAPTSRTAASEGFSLEPLNVTFAVPATVSIPTDSAAVETAIYRHIAGEWVPLLPTTTTGQAGLSAPSSGAGTFQAFSGYPGAGSGETLDPATAKCGSEVLEATSFGESAYVRWFWSTQDEALMDWDPIAVEGRAEDVAHMPHERLLT